MSLKSAEKRISVQPGDMVEIIEPWCPEENYLGLVLESGPQFFIAYHGLERKKITWSKNVNCNIFRYNLEYEKKEKRKNKNSCSSR